jgi:hypothetical protein
VLHNVSQTPAIQAAQQRLEALGIRVLGAVVNGATESDHYGYDHRYGYGYGYADANGTLTAGVNGGSRPGAPA